ncbi:ATP-binding protein [Streptomyces sp. NPDC021218]|uniref:ATP-binding protein n=1 Tax=Streptomyces sp. NPDC021218 TaxID=3365119 RepID=UPI003787FB05
MELLDGFTFYRLQSVPRPADSPARSDPVREQLFGALTATHAELLHQNTPNSAMAVIWHRAAGEHRMNFLAGGRPHFPPATPAPPGTTASILYPPGTKGTATDPTDVRDALAALPAWLCCAGSPDPLWTVQDEEIAPRGGFDDYTAQLHHPFAWLVLAEPLPAKTVDQELLALATAIPRLRQRENSELDRVALHRAQARYRELSRARTAGMWSIHILVGGADESTARRAAALLCASSDLDQLPYVLHPNGPALPFHHAVRARPGTPDTLQSPFTASTSLLTAIARPPRRELPGIRLIEPADFDMTPEREGPLHLGDILDQHDAPAGPFTVDTATLNRHTFVAGATGGGKSQTVRHLLEQLHHADIPWLVIEPAKAEYAAMAGRIGANNITVIRPGAPDAPAVGLNPLEPEPGFPLQTHIDLTRALFLAAFEASEPFPQVLSQALTRCYTDLGWDLVLSESRLPGIIPRYPTLTDLQKTALDVVEHIGYGKEITDNVRGFIDVRLGSLRLGTPGRFFEDGHPLDITDLLRRNTVLEIEDVGNDQDKAFFIGAILIRLHQHLRNRRAHTTGPTELQHVTVVEEAHRLLKRVEPGSPAAHAVELFTALLAEIRAYGEGIVIAEQIPAKIVPDVIKNTALKLIHRLPSADDRTAVGATMNLDDSQSRHLVSLPPGRAVAFTDGMDRPLRIAVPLGEAREKPSPGTPATIRNPRSAACGPHCQTRPCVLREMNHAARLADDPRLTLWTELLTIAHLVGKPAPRPDKTWLTSLTDGADRRTLECALAHRINTAINTRYTGLAAHYQPEHLAQHLTTSALATLDGQHTPCDGTEYGWQAGRYRWTDVFRALKASDTPDDGPHPSTADWAARGLTLSATTTAGQLKQVRAHPDSWLPDDTVLTGTGHQPAYAQALTRLDQSPTIEEQFLNSTRFLHLGTTWPLIVLQLTETTVSNE